MKICKYIALICISILMFTIININNVQALEDEFGNIYSNVHKYNSNDELSINVKDVSLNKEEIYLDSNYDGVAIVTLQVKNNDVMDLELSNIDVYSYQNKNLTKCFVTTQTGDINGMIGNLKSGETTEVKIGVTLQDLKNPLELEFINIDENQDYKIKESIDIDKRDITSSKF